MASSNFKVFAEGVSQKDIQSDSVYESDAQRVNGVVPGVADPKLHNKLYKQATVMAAALAHVITQAGFDARDDDYSGLVDGIRKTFAGSVNNVKPDNNGNIDLTEVIDSIRKMTYPRVGDFIITKNPENPSKKYDGTTWELLEEKVFIMSAGKNKTIGKISGSNEHTLTVDELPSHTHHGFVGSAGDHTHGAFALMAGEHYHDGSTDRAGEHYHTGNGTTSENGDHTHGRGTMNIKGQFSGVGQRFGGESNYLDGAFYYASEFNQPQNGAPLSNDGQRDDVFGFDAARAWTGSTSSNGKHSHSFYFQTYSDGDHKHGFSTSRAGEHTHQVNIQSAGNHDHSLHIGNTGNGSSIDMRPRHISAYIWIRTA